MKKEQRYRLAKNYSQQKNIDMISKNDLIMALEGGWDHTCKKREIAEIYLRKFFWVFRKILG